MANLPLQVDSACDNLIRFPVRHKGRKRKIASFYTEGMHAMYQVGDFPDNVAYFDQRMADAAVSRNDIAAFVAIALIESSSDLREKVRRRAAAHMVFGDSRETRQIATRVIQLLGVKESSGEGK